MARTVLLQVQARRVGIAILPAPHGAQMRHMRVDQDYFLV